MLPLVLFVIYGVSTEFDRKVRVSLEAAHRRAGELLFPISAMPGLSRVSSDRIGMILSISRPMGLDSRLGNCQKIPNFRGG